MTTSSVSKLATIEEATRACKIGVLRSADDSIDLRYGLYQDGPAEPRQYVVFLNGRSEWVEKYAYLPRDLSLPPATAFLTWDHRGQGASGGARAYVDDYATYVSDAQQIISKVVGGKPYVLAAHSMGSLIGLFGVLQGTLTPRCMVLGSPLLGIPNKPVPRVLAKPLSRLLTLCGLGPVSSGAAPFEAAPFEHNILTHDYTLYQRSVASPYKLPGPTFGWVAATFNAIDACYDPAQLAKLKVPTLVMGAGLEAVVDPDCSRTWMRAATAHAKAELHLAMFAGAKHELLAEAPPHYEEALKELKAWIKPHLAQ